MDTPALALIGVRTVEVARPFEEFFEAERDRLYRALFLVTGNRHEAEELMQDAFLKVWERWDRAATMDRPDGYLFRVAMNLFRTRYRRASTFARLVLRREPRDELSTFEDRDQLLRALAGLTPRQRAAVVLTELLDFDAAEAAEMLGVKPVTIRSLAHDGRESLRRTLERDHE